MKPDFKPACLWTILILCLFCPCVRVGAQDALATGIVSGTVIDNWSQQGLPGVVVTVRGTTLATTTDLNGAYEIRGVPPGEQVVIFSKPGYARTIVTEVRVAAGQSSKVDNPLRPEFYTMEEYEVTAAELESMSEIVLKDRQDSNIAMDVVGEDFIDKTGAGDVGEIMAKVTGVAVVDGKFVNIRGLGERYNLTTLNGGSVPSADPDKRAVQLDIFPSEVVRAIETSKTFTPDQPANFSGGLVNIVTKRYPDDFLFNVSVGGGYNTQATGNDDFLTYDGGDTDWAGIDDGTRDIPDDWEQHDTERTNDLLNQTRSGGGRTLASRTAAAEEIIRLTSEFNEQMTPYTEAPPPDMNFGATLGHKHEIFGRDFGWLASASYDRKYRFDDDAFIGRYQAVGGTSSMQPLLEVNDVTGIEEVNWSALVNVAYELAEGHNIAFNALYNRNSEDNATYQSGLLNSFEDRLFERYVLHYTERELQTYQLHGDHEWPVFLNGVLDTRTDWLVGYATTSQDEPDLRLFEFVTDATGTPEIPLSGVLEPTRFWRELEEETTNIKWDQTFAFEGWTGEEGNFKVGLWTESKERTYNDRRFGYRSNNSYAAFRRTQDPSRFLAPENLRFTTNTFGAFGFDAFVSERPFNRYEGTSDVDAGYAMLELPLVPRLRVVGGARYEMSDITVENFGERTGSSELSNNDLLPSIGFIYEVVTNVNVRLSYSETVARPTFDEIAEVARFDFINNEILIGNPDLQETHIENYDLRWEWFRRPGEVIAASLFYKVLEAPIEKTIVTANSQVQFQNRDEATVYGFELEARTRLDVLEFGARDWSLLDYFSVGANFTWVESEVDADEFEYDFVEEGKDMRPLQGQSPYIVNADITFDTVLTNPDYATAVSLFYNIFGERLSEVSRFSPNIYEQPVNTVDLVVSQQLGRHLKVKFAAKNLLDPTYEKLIDFEGQEYTYASYSKGRTFTISLGYSW